MAKSIEIHEFPLFEEMRRKHIPTSFGIEVTARCNFDCRHCYINLPAGDGDAKRRELTPDEIARIARGAVDLGALWCLVTGGEPLLRKDFSDIYLSLKRLGLLVSVYTNASLVTAEHVALFKQYPSRDIEVTVYGASQKTYERVTRQGGSFSAFRRGLDRLLDAGVRVRLKAMVLRSNIEEFEEISRFCVERTKDFYRCDPFLFLRTDHDPVRNADIRAERLSPMEIIDVARESKRFTPTHRDERTDPEVRSASRQDRLFQCGGGETSFSVSFDGRLGLCSSLCHPSCVYDLRQGTLAEAWHDFIPSVREMRSENPAYLENCARCELAKTNVCRWCPARAHLETGEMDRPVDYFCRIAHAQAALLQ